MSGLFHGDHAGSRDLLPLGNGLAADAQPAPQLHRATDDFKRLDERCVFHEGHGKPRLPPCPEKKVSHAFLADGKRCFHNEGTKSTGFPPNMTLGNRLKDARKAAGLTQAAVAERLSVTRPAVTQWERDATVPELENLRRLAELYSTSVTDLLGEGGNAGNRLERAKELLAELSDEDQDWYIKSLERDVEKARRGGA
ncbi:MAG: helix-turn-helix transcriptional regulator [Alphaproteobacteria bacterium]